MSHAWLSFPSELVVVSDGSATIRDIYQALCGVPAKLEVRRLEEYVDYHRSLGRQGLVEFSNHHPFSAKLAIFVREAEAGRFLWCDSDVLFFGDLSERIVALPTGPLIRVTRDIRQLYDGRMHRLVGGELGKQPPVNAGFVLAEQAPYDELCIDAKLAAGRGDWDWFTEQTIVAYFAQRMNGSFWGDDEMKITAEDSLDFLGNPLRNGWKGRHYIAPHRSLFWRDAAALQLRLSPVGSLLRRWPRGLTST